MNAPSRGLSERLQAWLMIGPLGHLWSAVADLTLFAVRELAKRARRRVAAQRRLAGAGSRPSERR